MAQQLRLVGASIDTYGSRRAWKRHRRVARRQQWVGTGSAGGPSSISLAMLAAASVVILALCTLAALVLGQIVFAAV